MHAGCIALRRVLGQRRIEIKYALETLKNVYKIWQRPVHLQAKIDDDMILFSYAGDQPKQQTIHDDLPKPAHQVQ